MCKSAHMSEGMLTTSLQSLWMNPRRRLLKRMTVSGYFTRRQTRRPGFF
jgi:hypothetical protein